MAYSILPIAANSFLVFRRVALQYHAENDTDNDTSFNIK